MPLDSDDDGDYGSTPPTARQDEVRSGEYVSETPCFDALFSRYDSGNGVFGTEHLGSLLLDMGFNCAPRVLDRALDEMDPNATGEISKLTFLEWFEANADDIDLPPTAATGPGSPRTNPSQGGGGNAISLDDCDVDGGALTQVTSAMLDAKNQRKRTEDDVRLLANRLVHLRAEEAKAQKRIEEANRRAKEMEAVKRRNAEHQRAKQRAMEQLQLDIRRMRDMNHMASSLSRERRNQTMNSINALRAQMVQETRAQRDAHLARIRMKRETQHSELSERSREIRSHEKSALKRRDELKKNQQRELLRNAREKLAQEYQKKLTNERLIKQMEEEETQLIERLRISHEMQRAAYEHLEFVIQNDDGEL
ncbi:hypothetical protein ATCC90586_010868 [Pythium insidiosum]|nr:hypothetical protein ATCC90586_010868 [Pythium insidiosum]